MLWVHRRTAGTTGREKSSCDLGNGRNQAHVLQFPFIFRSRDAITQNGKCTKMSSPTSGVLPTSHPGQLPQTTSSRGVVTLYVLLNQFVSERPCMCCGCVCCICSVFVYAKTSRGWRGEQSCVEGIFSNVTRRQGEIRPRTLAIGKYARSASCLLICLQYARPYAIKGFCFPILKIFHSYCEDFSWRMFSNTLFICAFASLDMLRFLHWW